MSPVPQEAAHSHLEPVDKVLAGFIVFFTVLLVGISKMSPSDGQTFQVLSGGLTTFVGAFVGRMVPSKKTQPPGVVVSQVDPPPEKV
jgi:hypothetical protein